MSTPTDQLSGVSTDTAISTTDSGAQPIAPQSDATPAVTTAQSEPAAPAWEGIIDAIPDDDNDLTQPTFQHVEGLKEQRKQLRVLRDALREHKPQVQQLSEYQQLGELTAIKPAMELTNLLYSELTDPRTGQPVLDPATQTTYVTTVPFLQYLDENSPGMPEQLLVDLLAFEPLDEHGRPTPPLWQQVTRSWGLDPARMDQYRNLDSLLATSSAAITAAELADIPAEYHAAYRRLLPSVRNAWAAYDEADQLMLLQREKDSIDREAKDRARDERDAAREMAEQQQYAALVASEQRKYVNTVRRERFASIANQLSKQITFSTDATTNSVMHGAVGTVMANLVDPELRFVSEGLLTSLGLKLDHTFDEALNAFFFNAENKVASEMQGDMVRASQYEEKSNAAANLLTTKLATIALRVAKAMGGQQAAAATAQGQLLATATTSRPAVPGGLSTEAQSNGILPPNIRPGTPEAVRWLAESTGFLRAV